MLGKLTQAQSGKAWEYGLARQCAALLNSRAELEFNNPRYISQKSYGLLPDSEKERINRAARDAVLFLRAHDSRLADAVRISIQSDQMGARGDVRDILIETSNEIIGISAKHRHRALKHSRLSNEIDFGEKWYGKPCSLDYWNGVNPVFERLKNNLGLLWRDLPNKHEDVYLPILNAFIREATRNADPTKMMRYLLGKNDFYKVIKENGDVSLQSFNIGGDLKWGNKIPLPDEIIRLALKRGSSTTAIMNMNCGWQISLRIHNASSTIEPSLKFDVQLDGSPETLSRHQIRFS